MIGLIRVLSIDDPQELHAHADAIQHLVDEPVVTRGIPDQPYGIHDDETLATATDKIIVVGQRLVAHGASQLIVSCAADPAVGRLRKVLTVPVIGAGSAAAKLARSQTNRVGVLGITSNVPDCIREGLGATLVAATTPDGVSNTTDLKRPDGHRAAVQGAQDLADQGAQAILFACTGLTTIGLAQPVAEATGTLVIDAVQAAGYMAGGHAIDQIDRQDRAG